MSRVFGLLAVGLLVICGIQGSAYAIPVADILTLEEQGKWTEAATEWQRLVEKRPRNKVNVRRWLLALEASGQHQALHEGAGKAMARIPGWEEPAIIRVRNWVAAGRLDDGYKMLTGLRSLEAQSWRGRILDMKGKSQEAGQEFAALIKRYTNLQAPTAQEHLAAGWAYRGNNKFHNAARAMESSYRDSLDYLPARLGLARLFNEKYQSNLAKDELGGARKLSPEHPELFLVAAEISTQNHNFVVARNMLEKSEALSGPNRRSRLLWAHMDVVAGQWDAAGARLESMLKTNSKDREALALWAAHGYMTGDTESFEERSEQLTQAMGSPIPAYVATADMLELAVRNQEAIDLYHRVTELDQTHAEAWSALGLLNMRMGREEEAREYLDKAFELDQFNVRAYNQLELLDFMETFEDYEYDTFTLRLLPAADSTLVSLMAQEMEAIRDDLTERLQWEPRNQTIIEVFPSHDWFSSRITGLAWVDGIPGVCFGDVLAMDSPRYLAGRSNWREILKHEFGHVMALDMTNRKVPFWFTEGLSVYLEDVPPGLSWDENLVAAAWDNGLVPIDSLTIAFTRPKTRFQRLLAYHQASLIIREIVADYGWDVIPKLLKRFGQGEDLAQAVQGELKLSWGEFQDFTMAAVRDEANSLNIWPRPSPERSARIAARPESPEQNRLELIAMYQEQRLESALKRAKEVLDVRPDDHTANGVAGLIYFTGGKQEPALTHLNKATEEGNKDYPVWMGLGLARLAEKDTLGAETALRQAIELYPRAAAAPVRLARVAKSQGRNEDAGDYFRQAMAADDELGRASLELALLEINNNHADHAAQSLEYALGILPLDPDVYAYMGRVKLLQDADLDAYHLFRKARGLDLRNVEWMVGMAAYYLKQEDYEEALYFANLALKYDPYHPKGNELRRAAEAEI